MIITITSKQGAQCFPKTPKESDQKKILGGISLKRILSTYCALSCCKVWKKSLERILEYKLVWFWATIAAKLPI